MEELRRFQKVLLIRAVISVAFFGAFIVLAISAAMSGSHAPQIWVLACALLAILSMPRRSLPDTMRQPPNDDPEAATLWAKMARMRIWLASARVIYLVTAIFLFVGLPELL